MSASGPASVSASVSASVNVIARGNVAVITGGASGIGLAMAERFIAEGMSVLLADIDKPNVPDGELTH